mmetsp:Transcript_73565/g.143930  ORF Transcript_73565/g.143930 Transcript_73565/m.143930 type:complete len:364 (-) Transcript_73565:1158-2249(-)
MATAEGWAGAAVRAGTRSVGGGRAVQGVEVGPFAHGGGTDGGGMPKTALLLLLLLLPVLPSAPPPLKREPPPFTAEAPSATKPSASAVRANKYPFLSSCLAFFSWGRGSLQECKKQTLRRAKFLFPHLAHSQTPFSCSSKANVSERFCCLSESSCRHFLPSPTPPLSPFSLTGGAFLCKGTSSSSPSSSSSSISTLAAIEPVPAPPSPPAAATTALTAPAVVAVVVVVVFLAMPTFVVFCVAGRLEEPGRRLARFSNASRSCIALNIVRGCCSSCCRAKVAKICARKRKAAFAAAESSSSLHTFFTSPASLLADGQKATPETFSKRSVYAFFATVSGGEVIVDFLFSPSLPSLPSWSASSELS